MPNLQACRRHAVYQYSVAYGPRYWISDGGYTYKIVRFRRHSVNHDAVFDDYFLFAICETASAMAPMLAPEVRLQFARRLKDMRTQRGFDRARYFARSLGIEENRYTRYERAEVEPSLTLIHKMCETLRVSPNELLGFGERSAALLAAPRGWPRPRRKSEGGLRPSRQGGNGPTPRARSPGAWRRRPSPSAMSRTAGPRQRAIRSGRCRKRARCFAGCRPIPSAR